jgi:subtilisin family serine protease
MDTHLKFMAGLIILALSVALAVQSTVFAKSPVSTLSKNDRHRYIVMLDDPPLAAYDGRLLQTPERGEDTTRLDVTAGRFTAKGKLDVNSTEAQQYLRFLDERFVSFLGESLLRLGRQLRPVHRYRIATNGFAADLSATEVRILREMPKVQSVTLDEIQKLQTDSGPAWLGADILQQGGAGFPASGGEGMVVGIFDTGINWSHPSFIDPGEGIPPEDGIWDHINPYGAELGLCSEADVLCNDKLVGVYDFVVDDPDTDVVEESSNGKDISGHGSHVASVVAGNPTDVTLNGIPTISQDNHEALS